MTSRRAQSSVVGVALLLGLTVVSFTALTVAVGMVAEEGSNAANARRVAGSLDAALETEGSGPGERRVALGGGRLRTVDRTAGVVAADTGAFVLRRQVGAVVYADGERRVRHVAGATVRQASPTAGGHFHSPPSVSFRNRTLFVGLTVVDASDTVLDGETTATLSTNITHRRYHRSGSGFAVAIETRTPGPFERYFEALGATTTRESDDGVPTVVARFPTAREVYVFVHRIELEVGRA
jgi:hypothetical protein